MSEMRFPVRVYYEDTDFGGVVYYANYLKFMERARTEALRARGIDQTTMKQAGVVFVVHKASLTYLAPARFDDLLEVRTTVQAVMGASALIKQDVWRDDTRLVAGEITLACMTLDAKVTRFPADVRDSFAAMA